MSNGLAIKVAAHLLLAVLLVLCVVRVLDPRKKGSPVQTWHIDATFTVPSR